ncbi:DUF1344 domain-containing protein, partial [Dysosmobacter welbionis]
GRGGIGHRVLRLSLLGGLLGGFDLLGDHVHLLGRGLNGLGRGGAERLVLCAGGGVGVLHQLRVPALDDSHHLCAGDGLLLQQVGHDLVHVLPAGLDDLHGLLVALV